MIYDEDTYNRKLKLLLTVILMCEMGLASRYELNEALSGVEDIVKISHMVICVQQ